MNSGCCSKPEPEHTSNYLPPSVENFTEGAGSHANNNSAVARILNVEVMSGKSGSTRESIQANSTDQTTYTPVERGVSRWPGTQRMKGIGCTLKVSMIEKGSFFSCSIMNSKCLRYHLP